MGKRKTKSDRGMTCEVCERHDPEGKTIDTLTVDVAQPFGLPEGRLYYVINYCHLVRSCQESAQRMANDFVIRHGGNPEDSSNAS